MQTLVNLAIFAVLFGSAVWVFGLVPTFSVLVGIVFVIALLDLLSGGRL